MSIATGGGAQALNMDLLSVTNLATGTVVTRTATSLVYEMQGGRDRVELSGAFSYNGAGGVIGGTIFGVREILAGAELYRITGVSASAVAFFAAVQASDETAARTLIFPGVDSLTGTALADTLRSYGQGDYLFGLGGADTLHSGPGADIIDGGTETDTVVFTGARANYAWYGAGDGNWIIYDRRTGAPDGVDNLKNVELLKFSDQTVAVGVNASAAPAAVLTAMQNVLREAPPGNAAFATLFDGAAAGTVGATAAAAQMIQIADATTSVATLSYQFFTGRTPSSAGLDYLVSTSGGNANSLDSLYYQAFNLENRYINFAVNLGKNGEGRAGFEASYGALSLFDATRTAYAAIFGSTPNDAKVHALIDTRVDYFAAYGGDGATGIGTKAAMVGWLLAEAVKADLGTYETANRAYLTDLADGAPYQVNLLTAYPGTPFLG